jgi:hypothetical protein
MTERTTSRVIPRPDANDSIPVLTEVFELPAEQAGAQDGQVGQVARIGEAEPAALAGDPEQPQSPRADEPVLAGAGQAADVLAAPAPTELEAGPLAGATEEELRAVRTELLSRVMMRFRAEWPPLVQAQTEAALQDRLAPLATQIANELSRALEARLVEWLDATLEEIEGDPGEN